MVWIERKGSGDEKSHGLLIQIDDNVILYDKEKKEQRNLVPDDDHKVKLEMIQGQSGDFYFAIRDKFQSSGDALMCL